MDHQEYTFIRRVCAIVFAAYCLFALLVLWVGNDELRYSGDYTRLCGASTGESIGPLLSGHPVEQTFSVDGDYVTGVDVVFQTYARQNTETVTVELFDRETGTNAASVSVPMKSLKDGGFQNVSFGGYIDIRGMKTPSVRISSSSADPQNTVTVGFQTRANVPGQEMRLDGQLRPADGLSMLVHSTRVSRWYPFYAPGFLLLGILLGVYFLLMLRACREKRKFPGLGIVASFWKYQFLIQQLVSRDFKIKYKRSVLGALWSFLNPLLMMTVQYIVFSNLFRFDLPFYAVYLLSGIVLYSGFSEMTGSALTSITGNAGLITKVYVPKYIYPISKVLSTAINTALSLLPLFIVALITGLRPTPALLLLPFGLVCYLCFIMGISFALSSFMVFFRDTQFLWGVLTTIWMYATPIIYPMSILPEWMKQLERFNPLYVFISYLRTVLIDASVPAPGDYVRCLFWAVAALAIGGWIFHKTEEQFVLNI